MRRERLSHHEGDDTAGSRMKSGRHDGTAQPEDDRRDTKTARGEIFRIPAPLSKVALSRRLGEPSWRFRYGNGNKTR